MTTFNELGLSLDIIQALTDCGYQTPTDIQVAAIPCAMKGFDMLAAAQTGTGKTAAFMLPSIERLKHHANASVSPAMHPVRMLVLTPTRELADQIYSNNNNYLKNIPLRHTVIFGGTNIEPQKAALQQGCEIVVATVGRLLDHLSQKSISLNKVEILVLDEADRMLDMGFIDDVRKIIKMLPENRQILLFSATFAPEIRKLAADFMNHPQIIETAPQNSTAESVEQHLIAVNNWQKKDLLEQLISGLNIPQAIVFCNKKITVSQVTKELLKRKIAAASLHGDKSQTERLQTLADFKAESVRILVATDVAARGLDISELPFVINYELPLQAEDYVHRIGRTGRAGANGVALSLVEENEQKLLDAILQLTSQDLKLEQIEGYEPSWLDNPLNNNKKQSNKNNSFKKIADKNDPAAKCERIPGRQRLLRGRKREICALLLPNYGLKQ
ncbi:MAG: DEAD/DEAH box helicase [Neisseriaceae bacterium]|nr:DEAD/DEAH box helicase [Neisseriaceae bacterium]